MDALSLSPFRRSLNSLSITFALYLFFYCPMFSNLHVVIQNKACLSLLFYAPLRSHREETVSIEIEIRATKKGISSRAEEN